MRSYHCCENIEEFCPAKHIIMLISRFAGCIIGGDDIVKIVENFSEHNAKIFAWKFLKGVLNLIFDHLALNCTKNRFFQINFDLGFRVLWPRKLKIFKILFHLRRLMTSFLENLKSYNRLLTSIKLLRQFNPC